MVYFYQVVTLLKCYYVLTLTSFSDSPLHLLTIELADMLKNVVLHSVATALANRVLPETD